MSIRAILFDMDGLMIDTEPLYWEVARRLAREHGATVSDPTLRRMMGRSRHESMEIFRQDCGIIDASTEQLLERRENLMLERYRHGVAPMPGLLPMLRQFADRLEMAVVTSSPRKFTDVLLPALGIDRYFRVVQTGDGITNGKPDPEIYLEATRKLGLSANECVVLEDSRAGALAGHRAGCTVIAIPTPLTAGEDFSFADARVENLVQAAAWIEQGLAVA